MRQRTTEDCLVVVSGDLAVRVVVLNSVGVRVLVASEVDIFNVTLTDGRDELVCRVG